MHECTALTSARTSARTSASTAGVGPALTFALAALVLAGTARAQTVDVQPGEGDRVSVRSNGASAADVAQALGERTGISVVVTGDASTAVDVDIVDEPLVKAVAQLAPNHMLVRGGRGGDAPITEIVLMMPDGQDGGIESTEFLPTGEPTDGVGAEDPTLAAQDAGFDENGQPIEQQLEVLRDPDRAAAVRAAAASAVAAQAAARAAELGAGGEEALINGVPFDDGSGIDPATGEPFGGTGFTQ